MGIPINDFRFFYNARSSFRSTLLELLSFCSLGLWDTVDIPSTNNNYIKIFLATGFFE